MRKLTQEEVDKIIEEHQHFIKRDCPNWENMRADFSGKNLTGLKLRGKDLSAVDFSGACLVNVDLAYAWLKHTHFDGANLSGANLHKVTIGYARMISANLQGANLSNAYIFKSNLERANLMQADLTYAYVWANLDNANLTLAELTKSDFSHSIYNNATFDESERIRYGIILEEDLIGYKKLRNGAICKLLIPKGNTVYSVNNYKCRTQSAKVIEITDIDGNSCQEGVSYNVPEFKYVVGETVTAENFNQQYNVECAEGIHFFRMREEAEDYML